MTNELTESLLNAVGISNYNGIHVERVIGGWKAFGEVVSTKEQLDQLIKKKMIEWGKTIRE